MILVIFGAGASYDSVPTRRPLAGLSHLPRLPLADGLFSDRELVADALSKFPDCLPIISYLQSAPDGDTIEHTLEILAKEAETDPVRKRQMAAIRFYLHFMIWECDKQWNEVVESAGGITNYITLLDQLRRSRRPDEPVCLVTFNYDRMIERALGSVGVAIETISQYIENDAFKVFKLHGSAHWAREVDTPGIDLGRNVWEVGRDLIQRAGQLNISTRYRVVQEYPIGKSDGVALFPAIAVPVETKHEYECPQDHLDCLRGYLPTITKLLLIGWRGTEQHFLGLLKEALPQKVPLYAVAGDRQQAEEVIASIEQAGIRVAGTPANGGFSHFVVSREAEEFLRS